MKLLGVFFRGLAILMWLIISFGLGMAGLCEINALSEIKKRELVEQKENFTSPTPHDCDYQYQGICFQSAEALGIFIDQKRSEKNLFKRILEKIKVVNEDDVSNSVIFILTAVSFGIVGALTEQIRHIVVLNRERGLAIQNGQKFNYTYILEDVSVLYRPLFGGLVGFMALGITSLIPMLLQTTTEFNIIRPTALLFFCFFSGLMSDEIYAWMTDIIRNFFKKQSKPMEDSN